MFPSFSQITKAERLTLLRCNLEIYDERYEDIAQAVSYETGTPITWAREAQAWAGQAHMKAAIKALEDYEFFREARDDDDRRRRSASLP